MLQESKREGEKPTLRPQALFTYRCVWERDRELLLNRFHSAIYIISYASTWALDFMRSYLLLHRYLRSSSVFFLSLLIIYTIAW